MTTSTSVAPAAGPSEADQAAIAAVPARMVAAWAAHDADAFADLFTDDGTLILPGLQKTGKDEIRAFMKAGYEGKYKGSTVTGQPIGLKVLGPGAVALITMGGVLNAGDTELTSEEAIRASWILVKRDDKWLLSVYHNCPRDPA